MQRLLPPLVVFSVLVLVAVRTALEPARHEIRERVAGYVQGSEIERAHQALDTYLQRYGTPEDRWFAAAMYFRMRAPDKAIDAVWAHEATASAPDAARRFALAGLNAFGWDDEARTEPTVMEPRVLTIMVEGQDSWATKRLRKHATELDLLGTTSYFFPAYRSASSPPMTVLVEAFRKREEDTFRTAAALGALHATDYPRREDDLKRLLEVLADPSWRRQFRDVWCVSCLALGRSGDARAAEALRQFEARLEGSQRRRDREDLLLVRNGLLAAGEWDAETAVAEHVLGDEPSPMPTVWYGEALIHRYRTGDARSEGSLLRYWMGPGAKYPDLRYRIARAFLLQDEPPSEEAAATWVQTRMLPGLERDDMPVMAHVLAKAYRLRSGQPGARDELLELMREAGRGFTHGVNAPKELAGPFLEALRALYLYG